MKFLPYHIMVAMLLLLAGCGNHKNISEVHDHDEGTEAHDHAGHDEEHAHEEHKHAHGVIEFTEAQAESAGLETETVAMGKFSSVIRTSGEILPAQGDESTIIATTSGVVTLGSADKLLLGTKVMKGASVATISSSQMAEGDPVAKAYAEYEAAKKAFERAEGLLKINAISQKAYDQAMKDYETSKSGYEAYNGKIDSRGLSVVSPLTGYITQVLVNDGDYVTAGQPIASVSQNQRLQLRADVPETQWTIVSKISGANFKPSYSSETYSIKALGGHVVSVGRVAAQGSFYIPVIFEFNNTGNFIPGAFCEIYLIAEQKDNVISIPETALTEEQGAYFVYVNIHDDEYRKQEVKIGETDGIRREILKGLNVGDVVVTRGAVQVKLASVKGTIPGHTHNH